MITSIEEGISIGAGNNMAVLLLSNVFNVRSINHQSSSYNNCFLVALANSSFGHTVVLGPVNGYFALFLTFQKLEE